MDFTGIIFILYLLFLLGVGFWTFRLNKTQEDYLLAGRRLGPWVTAFSERASGESAWLLLALPGAAISVGLGESWAVIGIILGITSSWLLVAKRLREETEKYETLTIPEYLHRRFRDHTNIIRLFSALIISFFFTFYVSAQFHASGKVLHSLFNIPHLYGITLGAAVIIVYTLLGGFLAVAWTDLVQGILMFGTLIILPLVDFIELQTMQQTFGESLLQAGANNSSFTMGKEGFAALTVVLGGLSWGFGYLGQPHLLVRYMAIRDPDDIKRASTIAILWAIPGITGAFLIGLVALNYFGPEYFKNVDVEEAMPLLATKLLPSFVAGLFISGAVAAMMSTADSQLLVSASAITEDFIHQFLGKELSNKSLVRLSRITIVVLGIFAFGIAIMSQIQGKNIFGVVSYAWSGLGSAFGPVLVLTLWWKKTTRQGVIAGLVIGFLSTVIWANVSTLQTIVTERLASFVIAFAAVMLVSMYTQNKNGN
jgi:sodium/proline symporter